MRPNFQAMAKNRNENAADKQKLSGEEFIEKYQKPLGIFALAILVVVAGVMLLRYQKSNKNFDAQAEIFKAQSYFEQDSLDLALNGDGRNLGFLSIIDIYGGTDAGNLANFYAGAILLKQKNYQMAIDHLEDFSSGENIVQARAYALIGDAYMELGQFSDAASNYQRAADTVDDEFFSPGYLMKASLAYEKYDDYNAAIRALDKILNDYYGAAEYTDARKHKARLEGLASS